LVEDGISGGTTAAPRIRQLLAQVFSEVEGLALPQPLSPLPPSPPPVPEPAPAPEEEAA
jgi:hypothetical protein